MNLRDALATADHRSASICIHARGTSMPDQTPCEEYAASICADPTFREALVEAVAEAVHALHSPVTGPASAAVHDIELSQYEGVWTDGGYAAAIVARMLEGKNHE